MRLMLTVAAVLVFSVGISLFLLTERTDDYFAWTIANPLTAAFLGAGYWASGALELWASRERFWANARIAVPAVIVFTVLTLFVTLIHWDRFHFDDPAFITKTGTFFWLGVYAIVPVIMTAAFLQVGWSTGAASDPGGCIPPVARWVLIGQAAVMVCLGLALLVAPLDARDVWPWALTDLTGRAIGAWLFAIGIGAVHTLFENDLRRTRGMLVSYTLLAGLQFIALARYSDVLDWGEPGIWLYVAFLASMLICGTELGRRSLALKDGPIA
ncbi:MAG: hypothetical protein AB7T32_20770 [Dehalococcoidia bacterium]